MTALQAAIGAARTMRSEHDVAPKALVPVRLRTGEAWLQQLLTRESVAIQTLVKTEGAPVIEAPGGERPRGYVLDVAGSVEVLVGLAGHVDAAKEKDRIERNLKKIAKDLEGLQKRLALPSFLNNAPPEVVAEAQAQVAALQKSQANLESSRSLVDELSSEPGSKP
jgi:valyl-tRNA synthetase